MTEIEREIVMLDYVSMQAEECLEWSEEYQNYDDILKITPICRFLRILRNNEHRMQKFLGESINKYDIFKAFDKYQELEKRGIEINIYHHLEILKPLCDRIAILLIELLDMIIR